VIIGLPSLGNIHWRVLRLVYPGKPLNLTGRKQQVVGEVFENFKAWQIFCDDKIKVYGRRRQHKCLKPTAVRKTEK
jgi:hypothetical protein